MWMNTWDIDEMVEIAESDFPEILPFARYLADWRDTVNRNSDGWSSWRAGSSCASKLMELLQQAKDTRRTGGELPPRELFIRALTPIKTLATKRNLPHPELVEAVVAVAPARGPRI
jgi:hypothetical protein|nr:hypothetical protein [Neorhizobium tomejilense]